MENSLNLFDFYGVEHDTYNVLSRKGDLDSTAIYMTK